MSGLLSIVGLTFGVVGLAFGALGFRTARMWIRDCQECRILIAVKGKVALDATLVEVLAWNKALPKRERPRGGKIFQHNGVAFALARPKIGPAVTKQETRVVKDSEAPNRNRAARRAAMKAAGAARAAAAEAPPE